MMRSGSAGERSGFSGGRLAMTSRSEAYGQFRSIVTAHPVGVAADLAYLVALANAAGAGFALATCQAPQP
jgi:hypothetical protein